MASVLSHLVLIVFCSRPLQSPTYFVSKSDNDICAMMHSKFGPDRVDCEPKPTHRKFWEGANPECDDLLPRIVVRPTSDGEIQQLVLIAQEIEWPLCVKSGGHSYVCNHVSPQCLQVSKCLQCFVRMYLDEIQKICHKNRTSFTITLDVIFCLLFSCLM